MVAQAPPCGLHAQTSAAYLVEESLAVVRPNNARELDKADLV